MMEEKEEEILDSFQRTYEELKPAGGDKGREAMQRFQRTYEELKHCSFLVNKPDNTWFSAYL